MLLADFSLTVGTFQYVENFTWISSLGISYKVGVDGISIAMVFLTALLSFLAVLFSWDVEERTHQYMGLMLILEVGVMGVFTSMDYFLFYVFWEVVLIPMYFLIAIWGGPRRGYASIKFFIYTHIASLVMLLGILALYFQAGPALEPCYIRHAGHRVRLRFVRPAVPDSGVRGSVLRLHREDADGPVPYLASGRARRGPDRRVGAAGGPAA